MCTYMYYIYVYILHICTTYIYYTLHINIVLALSLVIAKDSFKLRVKSTLYKIVGFFTFR